MLACPFCLGKNITEIRSGWGPVIYKEFKMLRSCKYCGRIHDSKIDCGKKPKPKLRFIKNSEQIRYTTAMKKKSEEIKLNAKYLCEVCLLFFILSKMA